MKLHISTGRLVESFLIYCISSDLNQFKHCELGFGLSLIKYYHAKLISYVSFDFKSTSTYRHIDMAKSTMFVYFFRLVAHIFKLSNPSAVFVFFS